MLRLIAPRRFCICGVLFFLITTASAKAAISTSISSEIGSDATDFSRRSTNAIAAKEPATLKIQLPPEETPVPKDIASKEFFVKHIKLEGISQVSLKDVEPIVAKFENQDLNLNKLRAIAQKITQYYRLKGYITSRAYVPPQEIDNDTVIIHVVEGKLDRVVISGNKRTDSDWLNRYVLLKSGEVIQYNDLFQVLTRMNRNPDREVTAALAPGSQPETSDLLLNVDEQKPYHLAYTVDDYGTRLTGRIRQGFLFQYSNLLHRDDVLYNTFNSSDTGDFLGESLNYLLPVSPTGGHFIFSYSYSNVALAKEFTPYDVKGGANIGGIDYVQPIIDHPDWSVNIDAGFNPEEIWTTEEGQAISKNHLSVLHFGPSLFVRDDTGTTTANNNFIFGIPGFLGSDNTQFFADSIAISRIQQFLWGSVLSGRMEAQFTKDSLVSAEQFRVGGFDTVRGYDEGDSLGDEGYLQSLEWHLPPYFIPRDWRVPFRHETIWDTVQLVTFVDAGFVYMHHPSSGEDASRNLVGTGIGIRIKLTKSVSAKVDCGWPVGDKPADGGRSGRLHFGVTIPF